MIGIVGVIILYDFYGNDQTRNYFFISFNLFLCFILSVVSITPRVRRYNSSCGLLQSSFVSIYVLYFTWSAMNNGDVNPSTPRGSLASPRPIIGLIGFVFAILYSVLTSSRNNRARKLFFSFTLDDFGVLDDALLINSTVDEKWVLSGDEDNQQRVYDDERGSVCYNYSLFHLMFVAATLYLMMVLTR